MIFLKWIFLLIRANEFLLRPLVETSARLLPSLLHFQSNQILPTVKTHTRRDESSRRSLYMRVCVYGPLNCFCPRETDKTAIEEEEEERKENTDVINTSMVRAFKNIKIKRLERAIERETSNVSSATHRSTDVGISLRNRHFFFFSL